MIKILLSTVRHIPNSFHLLSPIVCIFLLSLMFFSFPSVCHWLSFNKWHWHCFHIFFFLSVCHVACCEHYCNSCRVTHIRWEWSIIRPTRILLSSWECIPKVQVYAVYICEKSIVLLQRSCFGRRKSSWSDRKCGLHWFAIWECVSSVKVSSENTVASHIRIPPTVLFGGDRRFWLSPYIRFLYYWRKHWLHESCEYPHSYPSIVPVWRFDTIDLANWVWCSICRWGPTEMGETESVCLRERQRAEAIKEVKRAKYVKIVMEYIYFFYYMPLYSFDTLY